LGIRGELDHSLTVAEWLEQWLAGKRKLRDSARRSYRQHLDHYLVPLLGPLPLDRLTPEHIADMFDLIEEWNAEILRAREEGRTPVLALDSRHRPKVVGVATQRRVFATLRNALNGACGKRVRGGDRVAGLRRIDWNPCDSVEMPEETREPARTWDPEQVGTFLASCEDDPLYLLFRLVLIHGPRRGEAVGARWTGYDHGTKLLRVLRPLLQLGGRLVESTPKTRAGERSLSLDDETNDGIRRLRVQQARNRLELGAAYEDNDLIWCRPNGSPYPPDYVSRRFRELAAAAGLPVIKLHEGRHSAATVASRRASTSGSSRNSWAIPRPRSRAICTSTSVEPCWTRRPRQSSDCCRSANGQRRRRDDGARCPFCVRPGRENGDRPSDDLHMCWSERRAWDSNPRQDCS
jgi:integrase